MAVAEAVAVATATVAEGIPQEEAAMMEAVGRVGAVVETDGAVVDEPGTEEEVAEGVGEVAEEVVVMSRAKVAATA